MKNLVLFAGLLLTASAGHAESVHCAQYTTGGFSVRSCPVALVAARDWSGPAMCRREDGRGIICPDGPTFDRDRVQCVVEGGQAFCWSESFDTPLLVNSCGTDDGEFTCNTTDAATFLRGRDR